MMSSRGIPRGERLRSAAGVTLIELMIAVAVLSVGVLGLLGAFASIQKAVQNAKAKTLAINILQEKMQILKQLNYYSVIVTSAPAFNRDFTPYVPYDPGYFPPETITEGGVTFTRLTYVQAADDNSGRVVTLSPDAPDAGMRLITVSVVWKQGGDNKLLQLTTIMGNPSTVMANAIISGVVTNVNTGAGVSGALVVAAQDQGYQDTSDANGNFVINLSPGSYNVVASARGYFTRITAVNVGANQTVTPSPAFALTPMSSGSVVGVAWMNTGPLISQVVVGTTQVQLSNFVAQYVELFNPTTYAITIGGSPPLIKLNAQSNCSSANNVTCTDSTYGIKLTYYNNTISSGGYYLIANTHTFTVAGTQVNADAVYTDDANTYCSRAPTGFNPTTYNWNISATPKVKMLFNPGHNGSFWLTDQSGALIDAVGWTHDGSPPKCEGTCVTTPSGNGLQIPEQLIRFASTAGVSGVWGPAYDSSNNTVDFSTSAVPVVRAHNTSTAVATIVAGKVPFGAVISATDTLSSPVTATSMGSPPYAFFSLVPVATGTWSVFIASRGYECQLDTVTLSATGSIYQFPSTSTFLNQTSTVGFITGRVTDAAGVALSGVPVNPGGAGAIAATNNAGGYILRVSPGSVDVFANQSGDPGYSSSYVAQSSVGVSVSLGVVTSGVNFMLSQGGRVTGFVTRDGTNPLPGKAMALFDSNGQSHDQAVSDSNGRFTMSASTGNYTVVGEVDSLESVSPSSCPVTIPTGATVWSATFTVSGALGYITGHVYTGSNPISSGVLILASTQTLSIPPPALSTATLTSASIYATSSQEDGSYSVGVRQSTNPAYRVSACYFTVSSSGAVSISAKVVTGRQVYAGQIDTGVDFTW